MPERMPSGGGARARPSLDSAPGAQARTRAGKFGRWGRLYMEISPACGGGICVLQYCEGCPIPFGCQYMVSSTHI